MRVHPSEHGIWAIIFVLVFFFIGNFIFTQYEILQIKNNLNTPVQTQSPVIYNPIQQTTVPTSSPSAVQTLAPTFSPKPTATPQTSKQIVYIPVTGGSTQNTDWTSITSSQFNFNVGDYGSSPSMIWDANLRATNPNDITYARIFDTTHQIAVSGSEISLNNNTNASLSQDVVSGSLQFWQGNNTYVIQVKSLNGSTAIMDSGRIKISY